MTSYRTLGRDARREGLALRREEQAARFVNALGRAQRSAASCSAFTGSLE